MSHKKPTNFKIPDDMGTLIDILDVYLKGKPFVLLIHGTKDDPHGNILANVDKEDVQQILKEALMGEHGYSPN